MLQQPSPYSEPLTKAPQLTPGDEVKFSAVPYGVPFAIRASTRILIRLSGTHALAVAPDIGKKGRWWWQSTTDDIAIAPDTICRVI